MLLTDCFRDWWAVQFQKQSIHSAIVHWTCCNAGEGPEYSSSDLETQEEEPIWFVTGWQCRQIEGQIQGILKALDSVVQGGLTPERLLKDKSRWFSVERSGNSSGSSWSIQNCPRMQSEYKLEQHRMQKYFRELALWYKWSITYPR